MKERTWKVEQDFGMAWQGGREETGEPVRQGVGRQERAEVDGAGEEETGRRQKGEQARMRDRLETRDSFESRESRGKSTDKSMAGQMA